MKFTDEYDRDDLIYINHLTFTTSMIMFVLCVIAQLMRIL